ncbi:hypothetical protein Tco_1128602, partial [Tanacetum coccineum]
SRRALKGDLGIGEEVVTWKLYLGLTFIVITLERMTIGCFEVGGGGGGGGGVFGVGVFGGSVMFSGDGVGNGVGAGLGYKNLECLKKAIAAQPKMYNDDMLRSVNLKIDSLDSEETLEDAKEIRLKMRNKMVQINYGKLNALYETFVPQQELSVKQTYFSIPFTSNNGSESKDVTSNLPIPKIPKEIKEKSPTENILQNDIDRPLEVSLTSELRDCVLLSVKKQKNELLKDELEKSSSDSKDIQANLLKRIKILENDFK